MLDADEEELFCADEGGTADGLLSTAAAAAVFAGDDVVDGSVGVLEGACVSSVLLLMEVTVLTEGECDCDTLLLLISLCTPTLLCCTDVLLAFFLPLLPLPPAWLTNWLCCCSMM